MARSLWQFVKGLFRRGDKQVTPQDQVGLRDAFADKGATTATDLAARLARGDLSLAAFQADMALLVRNSQIASFALGRGGISAMTDADRATLSDLIGKQLGYLRDFAREVAGGGMTDDEIAQRAAMYGDAGIEAHSRGQAAAYGVDLPVSPPLHPRCRCVIAWDGEGDARTWSWQTAGDPCPECADMAEQYQGIVP